MNKYLKNILWLLIDKFVLLVGGLVVSVLVAKHLGPEDLGKISFGISLGLIAVAVSQAGGHHLIFNIAAKNKNKASRIISATTLIRFSLYILVTVIISFILFSSKKYSDDAKFLTFVMMSSMFIGVDQYIHYFNATLNSKINAYASIIARLSSLSIRAYLIFIKANAWYFVLPYYVNSFIQYIIRRKKFEVTFFRNKQKHHYQRFFFKATPPLILTSVLLIVFSKITELILVTLIDYENLGLYTVANILATSWNFIPLAIGMTVLPKVINDGHSVKGMGFVLLSTLILSIPVLVITYFYSKELVDATFGAHYDGANQILFCLVLASMFSVQNMLMNKYIISLGGSKYILKKTIILAIISSITAVALINIFGIKGAALNLLFVEFISCTVLNYLFRNGKVFYIHKEIAYSFGYVRNLKV
ncbi:oligosaccharide flippase family protein [Vibrio breoganii]